MIASNFKKIKDLIERKYLSDYNVELAQEYMQWFHSKWPGAITSIVFYGSCLNQHTKKETSTPDFFIIAKTYFSFHKKLIHTLLNYVFTPNTYSISDNGLNGKFNVISLRDLRRETSKRAKDIYNLGRLSKRVALIYYGDNDIKNLMLKCFTNAYYTVARKTLYLMKDEFTEESFIESALNISYVGERRVEAADKISRLKTSEDEFYTSIYSSILEDFIDANLLFKKNDKFIFANPKSFIFKLNQFRTKLFIRRSIIRAKLRWPKSIYTFKGWVDTLINKIERTKGIKIELSEKERKYALIYGWKYYFKLKRDKLIK